MNNLNGMRRKSILKKLRTIRLTETKYEKFSGKPWPVNALMKKYGQAIKVRSPPGFRLHEAKTFHFGRYIGKKVQESTSVSYERRKLKGGGYIFGRVESYVDHNLSYFTKEWLEKFKRVRPLELKEPFTVDAIDKIIEQVAKMESVPYIKNLGYVPSKQPNEGQFLNPAELNSPLQLADNLEDLKDVWPFIGVPGSSSSEHKDDYMACTLNYCLYGAKLWITVHPHDTKKAIEKMREAAQLEGSEQGNCPQWLGDFEMLIPVSTFKRWGVRVKVTVQKKHEVVILGSGILHQCINLSLSYNQAVAFMDKKRCKLSYEKCTCKDEPHDVRGSFDGKALWRKWRRQQKEQLSVHKETRGDLKCELCNKFYKNQSSLGQHNKRSHGERLHSCPYCDKSFGTRADMKVHTNRKHAERTEKCETETCEYKSSRRDQVARHSRRCGRKLTYSCPICGKKYANKFHLKRHPAKCEQTRRLKK